VRFLSVCSGIEAASVAWNPLGWEAAMFAEIEPFPCSVLAHHYPTVPNRGDMTKFEDWPDDSIDLLCGGTPCQSFSVAGLRKGLDDHRGNLMLTYGAIAAKHRPRWLVWENVPGVLSSNGGRDFGSFLGLLGQLGYGFAYRVLDAQHFGVPQRRRRVFVVGCLGDWRAAAAVLLERHSLSGHPAPSRQAWQGSAGCLTARAGRGFNGQEAHSDQLISHAVSFAWQGGGTQTTLGYDPDSRVAGTLLKDQTQAIAFSAKDYGGDAGHLAPTLRAGGHSGSHANAGVMPAIAFNWQQGGDHTTSLGLEVDRTPTMQRSQSMAVQSAMQVRRLTPRECERLQGFPDDYTAVPHRSKPAADGPRYKALGNSWAVPCARWIGERINAVEQITAPQELEAA